MAHLPLDPWRRSSPSALSTSRSPLVASAGSLAIAIFLGHRWPPILIAATSLLIAFGIAAAHFRPRLRGRWVSVLIAPPILIGLHLGPVGTSFEPEFGPHHVSAVVVSAPREVRLRRAGEPPQLRFEVELLRVDGVEVEGRVRFVGPRVPVGRGDRLDFDYWHDPERTIQRLRHSAHIHSIHRSRWSGLDRARARVRDSWSVRFSPPVAAWFQTLLLGERASIDPATRQRFRDIGQSHLLAISGLHVGIIATLAHLALSRFRRLPLTARRVSVTALLLVYAGLAGADPAVIRATVLGGLATLAVLRRRRGDALNALCCSFMVLAIASPEQTTELGFVLTFSAVLSIVMLGTSTNRRPILERSLSRAIWLQGGRALRVSIAAWLGAGIPLALIRPEVTPLAPVFALVLTPLIGGLLGLGLLAIVATPLDPVLDQLALWIVASLDGTAGAFDALPGTPGRWPVAPPVTVTLALTSLALVGSGRALHRPALIAIVAAILVAALPRRTPSVVVPDLGRGQAIFIVTPQATVLADAGSVDRELGGADVITTELWRLGRSRLDLIVLSHPHADHVLAIPELIRRVPVGQVWVNPEFDDAPLGSVVLRQLDRSGIPWKVVSRGDRGTVGDLTLAVLYPPARAHAAPRTSTNDGSIVLQVRHRDSHLDLVVPGDIEAFALSRTASRFESRAEIVVLPHHGRSSEGLEAWVDALDPLIVLGSNVGRPEPPVERLSKNRRVLLTSVHGDLRVSLTPEGWRLEARPPGWKSLGAWSTVPPP